MVDIMDFGEKKSRVAFMSTMDREMFPMHMARHRLGNDQTPIRGEPHRGPGCYNNEEVSNMKYVSDKMIHSQKGYVLGARTAQRFRTSRHMNYPAPPTYQTGCTEPMTFDPSFKPFEVGAQRFPVTKREQTEVLPGPGTYEHGVKEGRNVSWHQSFGGTPINLPNVKIQSTINQNTDKLLSTKEEKKYHRRLAYLKLYYD